MPDRFEIRPGDRISFVYKNYRGETSGRLVDVQGFIWGSTQWHPEPGLLLEAMDIDKGEVRLFATADMTEVSHA